MPFELLEAIVIEKTGWTFDELDRQESGRVLRMMEVIGIRDSLRNEYSKSQQRKKG